MPTDDTIALVCGHVVRAERPVRLVVHHADGDWQFGCGEYDHAEDPPDAAPLCIGHLLETQPQLRACLDLEPGFLAEATSEGWVRTAHDD